MLLSSAIATGAIASQLNPSSHDEQVFAALCKERAGWKITGAADGVRGYFLSEDIDFGEKQGGGCPGLNMSNFCITALLSHNFEYVETEVSEITSASYQKLVESTGLYRFEIKDKGHPDCGPYENYLGKRGIRLKARGKGFYSGEREKLIGLCVATSKIEKLQSKYMISITTSKVHEGKNDTVFEDNIKIQDIKQNVVLAEYSQFSSLESSLEPSRGAMRCPEGNQDPMNMVREILRP